MPAATESGMAIVLVQHLDPTHKSLLSDLVKQYTRMQVHEVEDGMAVEPTCAYIIPPNKDMALLHGTLQLMEPVAPRGLRLPIDFFFRSLAQDQRERAICIVLSGTGTDGTLGLKAIKEVGGMAMAQDPQTAKYDGMPRSAIATGLVDYVLPARDMPEQLIAYVQHAFGRAPRKAPAAVPKVDDLQEKIFVLLRAQTGHDFSYYKQNTVRRRIERRLALHQIEKLDTYVSYLQQNPLEVEALFRELLIGVTSFFRAPEAFEVLAEQALPRLLTEQGSRERIRVWVPGCSTGEEAYSIAMLLQEQVEAKGLDLKIQVFATDIDREAIDKARAGAYPNSIAADISPERLARFFRQEDAAYHVKKVIRDQVVFAIQDVVEDPPFSKIDLISCRNLLIYMEPELQRKVIALFHYALKQDGFLLLGILALMGATIGIKAYVLVQVPIMIIAGAAGVWMFYVQHQFEGVYWERHDNWDFATAALKGSSFYKLPKVLQWFTGNIGFHHIHHLSPRIPNYNLESCYRENPIFQEVKPITILSSLKSLTLRMWDEKRRELVGFGYLKTVSLD